MLLPFGTSFGEALLSSPAAMSTAVLHDFAHDPTILLPRAPVVSWPTLLVVDDDLDLARGLVCFFEKRGFHVAAAASLNEAKVIFGRHKTWSMVISELHLPDGTGWEFYQWLRDQHCPAPLLLTSSSPFHSTLGSGLDCLPKPFSLAKIEARVRAVIPAR